MRPREVVMLVALVPVLAGFFVARGRRPRWWKRLAAVPLIAGLAHVLIEGYSWQMVPAYALVLLLLAVALVSARGEPDGATPSRARVALRLGGATCGVLVWVVDAGLPALFPVFQLPQPTGPHGVGFGRFALLDSTRQESFTADPTDKRALMVEAWYPAQRPSARRAVFWGPEGVILPRLASALGLPWFLFGHLALVRTHAYLDAQPASSPALFPALIFSHGYDQGFAGQNTAQMEELASHGYAVFSIAHPYESLAVAYPDGRIVTASKSRMDSVGHGMRASGRALRRFAATTDRTERTALFRQAIAKPLLLHESLRVWTADTRFVIDALTRMTAAPPSPAAGGRTFAGKLDLTRIGVFGMSFGGTTAGQVCVVDPRCKAGVNLDGTQYGDPIDVPLRVPFMFMTSSISSLNDPVYERVAAPAYSLNVEGSTHFNCTDFSMMSPLFKRLGILGPIDGARMERIMNEYLVACFDTYVKGERGTHAALLNGSTAVFPEVKLSSRVP